MATDKIIGTGLSGLVGSRIVELLGTTYSFEDVSRTTGTDITNLAAVLDRFSPSNASIILHLAAKTDVDGAEKEKELGKQSETWKINVIGTKNIIEAAEKFNKKIIYVSTDMIFNGNQKEGEKYSEEDIPDASNFYAQTKQEAEKLIIQSGVPYLIMRIAYPYRAQFQKKEYVRIFKSLLEEKREIKAVADHFFTPTFIDDVAQAFDAFIASDSTGIYHVVGDEVVSAYIVAKKVARAFGLDESLISPTTRAEFFNNRAIRGFNLSLKNDKIKKLGVKLTNFTQGLEEIKKQTAL